VKGIPPTRRGLRRRNRLQPTQAFDMLAQDDTDSELEVGFGVVATRDTREGAWLESVWLQSPSLQAAPSLRGNHQSLGCEAEAVRSVLDFGHGHDSMMIRGNPSWLDEMRRGSL
jgi:hypothetical protein